MTYCDDCIRHNMCEQEGAGDEAMTFCSEKVKDISLLYHPIIINRIFSIYKDKTIPEFNTYVDRYCVKHKVTPEIACKHALVVEAYIMYRDKPIEKKGEGNVRTTEDYSDDRSC